MRNKAFTLIEVLVIVAIVGILLAISAGVLKVGRERARRAQSLSNLRAHSQIFSVYTNEFADQYPYFMEIGCHNNTVVGGGLEIGNMSYFDAHRTWHIALADMYYEGQARSRIFLAPSYDQWLAGWPFLSSYLYGCVFVAHAQYWNQCTRTGPQQYQPTHADSVRFPSAKALIVEHAPFMYVNAQLDGSVSAELPVAFCDGSARRVASSDRLSGYPNGDGSWQFGEFGAVHFVDNPPLLHTIDGVHGRDVR